MKERLVGAAVLVAIAVWLVPWVLDGPEEGIEAPSNSLQLPSSEEPMPMRTQTLRLGEAPEPPAEAAVPSTAQPSASPVAEPEPAAVEPTVQAGVAVADAAKEPAAVAEARPAERPAAAAAAPSSAPSAPPKPAPAPAGDWTVQLGSFGEEPNARRLAQRAATFGYKAEVSSYRNGGRTMYRVRVGPQPTRAAADAAASALRAHGVDARVVSAR